MVARLHRTFRSSFGLAIYLVCFALVCSFILFEVLDIDGSDFPAKPRTVAAAASQAEARHEMRRAFLTGHAPAWMAIEVLSAGRWRESVGLQQRAAHRPVPMALPRALAFRAALPRASLADAPPSA